MKTFSVAILLLLSATIAASLELNGEYSVSNRDQTSQRSSGLCSELVCSTTDMELTLEVAKLKEMNVDVPNIHLKDRNCTGFTPNGEILVIKWALGKDICGTERTENRTHVVYRNYIYLPPDPAAIIYREDFLLNVSCTYPRYLNGSNDNTLIPDLTTTVLNIDEYGKFKLKMAIYKDDQFRIEYTDSVIRIPTKSNLYVGVYIAEADNSFALREFRLLMINCYSTPTNNWYDSKKYDIITESCPNPRDSTIHVVENGISTKGKFYIQMFKFIGDYDAIYLHCQVYLCLNTCAPSCARSRSISEIPQPQGTLTVGPIRLTDGVGTTASFSVLTVLGLLLANIFIV